MTRLVLAALLAILSACASTREPPAAVGVDAPAVVPDGIKPLTVEQVEDSVG